MGDSKSTLPSEPLVEKVKELSPWHTLQNPGLGVGFTETEKGEWWKSKDYKYKLGTVRSVDLDKQITIYSETFDMSKKQRKIPAPINPYTLTDKNIEKVRDNTGINMSDFDEELVEKSLDTMKNVTDFEDLYLGWISNAVQAGNAVHAGTVTDEKDSVIIKETMKTLFRFVFGKKTINDKNKAEKFYAHLRFAYTKFKPEEKVPCKGNTIADNFKSCLEYRLEGVKKEISAARQSGFPEYGIYARNLYILEKGLIQMINFLDSKSGCFEYGEYSGEAKRSEEGDSDEEAFLRALMVAKQIVESDAAASASDAKEDSLRETFIKPASGVAAEILKQINDVLAKKEHGDFDMKAKDDEIKRLKAEIESLQSLESFQRSEPADAAVSAALSAAMAAEKAAREELAASRVAEETARREAAAAAAAAERARIAGAAAGAADARQAAAAGAAARQALAAAQAAAAAAEARLAAAQAATAAAEGKAGGLTARLAAAEAALAAAEAEKALASNNTVQLKKTILVLMFSLIRSRRAFELLSVQMDESEEVELERIMRDVDEKIAGLPEEARPLVKGIFNFLTEKPVEGQPIEVLNELIRKKGEAEKIIEFANRLENPLRLVAVTSVEEGIASIDALITDIRKKLEDKVAELNGRLRGLRESLALKDDSEVREELSRVKAALTRAQAELDDCNRIRGEQEVSIAVLEGKIDALGLPEAKRADIDERLAAFEAALRTSASANAGEIKREFAARTAGLKEEAATEAAAQAEKAAAEAVAQAEKAAAEAEKASKEAADAAARAKADSEAAVAAAEARAKDAEAAAFASKREAEALAAANASKIEAEIAALAAAKAMAEAATSASEDALKAAKEAEAAAIAAANAAREDAEKSAREKAAADERVAASDKEKAAAEERAAASQASLEEAKRNAVAAVDAATNALIEQKRSAEESAATALAEKEAAVAALANSSAQGKAAAAASVAALKEATERAEAAEAARKEADSKVAAATSAAEEAAKIAAAELAKAKEEAANAKAAKAATKDEAEKLKSELAAARAEEENAMRERDAMKARLAEATAKALGASPDKITQLRNELAAKDAALSAAGDKLAEAATKAADIDSALKRAKAAEEALAVAKRAAEDAEARASEIKSQLDLSKLIYEPALERHSEISAQNEELLGIIIKFIQTVNNKDFNERDNERIREELTRFAEMNTNTEKRVEAALAIIDAITPHITEKTNPVRRIEEVLRNIPAVEPVEEPVVEAVEPVVEPVEPVVEPVEPVAPVEPVVEPVEEMPSVEQTNNEMIKEIKETNLPPETQVKIFKFILQQLQLFASAGALVEYIPLVEDRTQKYSHFIDNYYINNKIKNPSYKGQGARGVSVPEYLVSDGKSFWNYIEKTSEKDKAIDILLKRINDIIREYSTDPTVVVERGSNFPKKFTEEMLKRLIYLLKTSFATVGITNLNKQKEVKGIIKDKIQPIILSIAREAPAQTGGAIVSKVSKASKASHLCDLMLTSILLKLDGPDFNYQALIDKAGRTLDDIGQCDLILDMLNHLIDEHCLVKKNNGYTFSSVYMDISQARALVEAFNNNFTDSEKQKFYSISGGVFNYKVPDEHQTLLGKHPFFLVGTPSSEREETTLYGVIDEEITLTMEERSVLEEDSIPIGAILFLYIVCFRENEGHDRWNCMPRRSR